MPALAAPPAPAASETFPAPIPEVVRIAMATSPVDVVLGRSSVCAVRIEGDPDVSRTHAELHWIDGSWHLKDLGSANGTYVGEFLESRRLTTPIALAAGQIFRIGATRLRLEGSIETDAESRRQSESAKVEP